MSEIKDNITGSGDAKENQIKTNVKPSFENCYMLLDEINEIILRDTTENESFHEQVSEKIKLLISALKTIEEERKDTKKQISEVESLRPVEDESQKLLSMLHSKRKSEERVDLIMVEYEKAISNLVTEKGIIIKERDRAQMHLANIEAAFSDVHEKYERCKSIIEGFKNNEAVLKETIRESEEALMKQTSKYEALKTHAISQLDKANNDLLEISKMHESEIARLKASLQKLELKNSSLTVSMAWKTKECEELTRICDELITKVGH